MSRKDEGRGLTRIEESVFASIQRLEDYTQKRGGRLITATRNNTDNVRTNNKNKQKKTWMRLKKKGDLRGETDKSPDSNPKQYNKNQSYQSKNRLDATKQLM